MIEASPLIVPLVVEAVVVNDELRIGGDNVFLRTQMQYGSMLGGGNAATVENDGNFGSSVIMPSGVTASAYYNGVYLKWRLPRALATGAHSAVDGTTTYPRVPNRWLVVRHGGADLDARTATAWIVESDYLWPPTNAPPTNASQVGSLYVVPAEGPTPGVMVPTPAYIGRNVRLGTWTESGHTLGLTAMGPGNPAFSVYQPHNNNVFSFIDPLDGVGPQTLSYQVLGWYSAGQDDPLACATDPAAFRKLLATLGWELAGGTDPTAQATWSLFSGGVNGVGWQTTDLPAGGAPGTPVSIAVGNTSIEALTALITAQAGDANLEPELLEAFQLDLLGVLDQPDGAAQLADKLQASFFQRHGSGYTWTIVDAPHAGDPTAAARPTEEATWLAALVTAQQQLDADARILASLQGRLYQMWWKLTSWQDPGGDSTVPQLNDVTSLEQQLAPSFPGSLAAQVAQQLAMVQADRAKVPTGDTPDALNAAIAAYATARGLPPSRLLKRGAARPFHVPNNPVVLIAGAGSDGVVATPARLTCRFPSELVTGFTFGPTTITAQTPGLTIPQPALDGVAGAPWSSGLATCLVEEAFLLDRDNAGAVARAIGSNDVAGIAAAMTSPARYLPPGCFPAGAVQRWTKNPWHPLLLVWSATYYPIEYGAAAPNWTFRDGRYTWNTSPSGVGPPLDLGGLIQLTPAATFNMGARLRAFLANNPNLAPDERAAFQALYQEVQTHDAWDLLSQSLDGFNDQLRLGMPGVFLHPSTTPVVTTPTLTELLGGVGSYPPSLGDIPTAMAPAPTSQFQPWRAGQFCFSSLTVVDEWGQALEPIDSTSAATERIFVPDDLVPVLTSTSATLAVGFPRAVDDPATGGPGPTIASLTPNLLEAGMAPTALVSMTITGAGFDADAVAHWGGTPLATIVGSSTSLSAEVLSQWLAAPAAVAVTVTTGGVTSPPATFTISAGPAIGALSPASVTPGADDVDLTVRGVGFSPWSVVSAGGASTAPTTLATRYVSETELHAVVPAALVKTAGQLVVTESVGAKVIPADARSFVQLPPALLQPARLDFDLVSAADDAVVFGPANPAADPVCGWVLPNHLDASLATYDPAGRALGEMSIAMPVTGPATMCWTSAPGSPYPTLPALAAALPHFGPFLVALHQQSTDTFTRLLRAIDETLWTTVPMGAVFDASLAVLVGRPLAMVRARLALELDGPADLNPSWQFTFASAQPEVLGYPFAVELGNIARLDDGLVGYFVGDTYTQLHVVQEAGAAAGGYFQPIGADGDYLPLSPGDPTATYVSMLVDPRAPVHATTAILPTASLAVPASLVDAALAAMDLMFRVDGLLTDQTTAAVGPTTLLMPTPAEKRGTWSWLENDSGTWRSYAVAPNDTVARLSDVAPVLRRGLLQLANKPKDKP